MSQVIIVSNRLPVSVKKEDGKIVFSPSVGGLATGLSSYANSKQSIWIGWPGIASDELSEQDRHDIVDELAKQNCSPVFLSQKQIDDFYNGYSNTVLWPLFHSMRAQDQPGERRDKWYKSYQAVNKLFAETIEIAAGRGARIWVHDYQLLLVPEMLVKLKVEATIGFFLHIPFPEPKKFMSLPRHKMILKGVLGADLIGFHTPDYVENFLKTAEKSGLGVAGDQTLTLLDRSIRVADFPMGIDYEKYASSGRSKIVKRAMKKYRRLYRGKKIIVAVDRLDPSKGLLERVKSYAKLLDQYPKLRGKVVFSMVAAPSRTDVPAYKRLAERLNVLVDEINKKYGSSKWQPIDYINRTVPFEEVTALFRVADVAFIAPLRDGMNLAAKEFIASAHRNSVLILSETAGAAQELQDALIVNPRKPETVVKALYDGLTMRRWELRRRLKRMKQYLKVHTVQNWATEFVNVLSTPLPRVASLTRTLNQTMKNQLVKDFGKANKRLLLLDYDGTLVPFSNDYHKATPTKEVINLIKKLGANPKNDVVVISGRNGDDLDQWFGKLPINLVAEHGASTKLAGGKWRTKGGKDDIWKQLLLPVLEKYARLTPHAKVEVKAHALVWHYRSSPPYYAQKYSVILRQALRPVLKQYGLEIVKGNKVLEIKNPTINKGSATAGWLRHRYGFIAAIGDDLTDEDMFNAIPTNQYTIKVGRRITAARYRVKSHQDVIKLLQKLAKS